MLYAIVGVLVIIVDQWVKYWVAGAIDLDSVGETFIPGIISLVNLHNDGAAFSFLSGGGARIYFIILTGVFTVAVILALATNFISGRVARWSIVLVTAGGLSNCIDRIIYGYVQDMFKVELFNFAVFNVADVFITVFAIIFALAMIFGKDEVPDDEDSVLFEEDDEEEDKPRRRLFKKRDKNDDYDDEMPLPAKVSRKSGKKESEYEQYMSSRPARPQQAAPQRNAAPARPARPAAPSFDPADPFAEWERANARVDAQQKKGPAAKAAGAAPNYTRPAAQSRPAPETAPVRPAPQAEPVRKAPAAEKSSGTDFSLDDILAEYKK